MSSNDFEWRLSSALLIF